MDSNPILPDLHLVCELFLLFPCYVLSLLVCFWLAWASVFATECLSVVFEGFFYCVLGFLVPPLCFCGLGGGVKDFGMGILVMRGFSESCCRLGFVGLVCCVFYCWYFIHADFLS